MAAAIVAPAMPDNRQPMPISFVLLAGRRRATLPPPKAAP
jgi:hypothetical protein